MNDALLTESMIDDAIGGNDLAITAVLKHYEGYIRALSTRQYYDKRGNAHDGVDDGLRHRLESKLIKKILTFEVA